jgi:RNA-directed DNA polymerase
MQKLKTLNIRSIKHLCKHLQCSEIELIAFWEHPEEYYRQFKKEIKGKKRPIAQPIGRFAEIIYKLKNLLDRVELPAYLHGGVKGRSTITIASCHIGKSAVLNFDLEGFFPSVKPSLVYNLFNERLGCWADVSRFLTRLVTLNGGLPQGSPTSTVVANLIIIPLAVRLKKLAEKHNSDYGQFVDDGTISGPGYIERLRPLIDKIIQQAGFRASPKPNKRTTKYRHEEQIVTGVAVNRRIDAPKQKILYVKKELNELHIITDYGKKISLHNIASVKGKIQHIKTLNKQIGETLENKLGKILNKAS